jgi:Domain of unknown function (DUF4845)
MYWIKRQDGLTVISILFIVVLLGTAVLLTFRLVPIYIEHFGVVSSLKSMEKEPDMHAKSPGELLEMLRKRLEINDVKRVTKENIFIKRQQRDTRIQVAYEVQVPVVSNISLLVTFDSSVTLH